MNTQHYIMAHRRPAFTSLRDFVRSSPGQSRFGCAEQLQGERRPRWMRLELDQLEYMIRELESGFHLVHPSTLLAVQQHRLHVKRTEYGNQRMHDARTPFEDRYEDDREMDFDASEVLPRCWVTDSTARPKMSPEVHAILTTESDPLRYAWHYQMWRYQNRLVTLEDGRWAYRLDVSRAQPLCGVLGTVRLSEVELRANENSAVGHVIWITGSVQCSECGGMHGHPVSVLPSAPRAVSEPGQICDHCHGTALESIVYGRDGYQITDWHCVNCGWYPKSAFTTLPLSVVEANLQAVPARFSDLSTSECLQTQLEVVSGEEVGSVLEHMGRDETDETSFEMESDTVVLEEESVPEENMDSTSLSDEIDVVPADLPAYDELLASLQGAFWKNRHAKYLRGYLLDLTMRYTGLRDHHARRDLVWSVASVLSVSCELMCKVEQCQLGRWILKQSDEELRSLLPEVEMTTELTTGQQVRCVPPMDGWLQQWRLACVKKRRSYLYRKAAARRFAPYFGVYQQTFLRAVGKD